MNLEMNSKMAELQTKYETEKKEKQIAILQKDKQLTQVEADRQRAMKLVYLISSLVILIISIFIIAEIRNRNKRKQEILEKQNLENEQRLLRTQMNPHFLFNSLNTVQGFISANDGFKAMSFLSKFGNLLRDILENSRENFISLENELETLKLYIEMEKLRYNNIFDFEITVDENLDPEFTQIPPLIIQPFVENSIKHGLSTKKGDGFLKIELSSEKNFVKIIITDNGIGRKKAGEISASKTKKHKSLGLELTTERLKNIEVTTGLKTSLEIIDLSDHEGKATGTMVIITIPHQTKT
jgi:LytS/YehU family sensor histidine kinase